MLFNYILVEENLQGGKKSFDKKSENEKQFLCKRL